MAASTILLQPLQSFLSRPSLSSSLSDNSSSSSSSLLLLRAFPQPSLGSGRRRARTWDPLLALVGEESQTVEDGTPSSSTTLPNDLSMHFKVYFSVTLADMQIFGFSSKWRPAVVLHVYILRGGHANLQIFVQVVASCCASCLYLKRAEGTLADSAVPKVVKVLEAIEGVSDVSVTIGEGIATVELSRQTNVQATSAASGLIETIQTQGFKLQNLSLVFDDDGKDDVYDYDYAMSE